MLFACGVQAFVLAWAFERMFEGVWPFEMDELLERKIREKSEVPQ